jgi:hypothetical protein
MTKSKLLIGSSAGEFLNMIFGNKMQYSGVFELAPARIPPQLQQAASFERTASDTFRSTARWIVTGSEFPLFFWSAGRGVHRQPAWLALRKCDFPGDLYWLVAFRLGLAASLSPT